MDYLVRSPASTDGLRAGIQVESCVWGITSLWPPAANGVNGHGDPEPRGRAFTVQKRGLGHGRQPRWKALESAKLMRGSELGGRLGSVWAGRSGCPGPAGLDTEVSGSESALMSCVGRGCLSLEPQVHPKGPAFFPQGSPFVKRPLILHPGGEMLSSILKSDGGGGAPPPPRMLPSLWAGWHRGPSIFLVVGRIPTPKPELCDRPCVEIEEKLWLTDWGDLHRFLHFSWEDLVIDRVCLLVRIL